MATLPARMPPFAVPSTTGSGGDDGIERGEKRVDLRRRRHGGYAPGKARRQHEALVEKGERGQMLPPVGGRGVPYCGIAVRADTLKNEPNR